MRRAPQKNAELISYSGQVNGKYQSTEQRRTQKGKAHITEEAGAQEAERLSTRQQEAKSEEVGERPGEAVGSRAVGREVRVLQVPVGKFLKKELPEST